MINRIATISVFALSVALALVSADAVSAHDAKAGDVTIGAAYARAMLPGAKVGGAYLSITNAGAADRLLGATSDRAPSVQIHEMKMENGVMIMREIKGGVPVPAKGVLELKPGGYHLMFVNVPNAFKQGETIHTVLTFEKAGTVDVALTVGTPVGGAPEMDHGGMKANDEHGGHGK